MKSIKLLILLILSLLHFSCNDDDNSEMNIECAQEVTFVEDGTTTTMEVSGVNGTNDAIFALKDPSPFDPNGVARVFNLRLLEGTTFFDIGIELGVDDATSCIPLGVYTANGTNPNNALVSITYTKFPTFFIAGLGEGQGTVEITKCDFENKLISGKFSGTLVENIGTESIVITDGVFEDVCLIEN